MRLMLSLAVFTVSLMCSREIYSAYNEKALVIKELAEIIDKMISLISYGNYDVYTLCKESTKNLKIIDRSKFEISMGDFSEQWKSALLSIKGYTKDSGAEQVGDILGLYDSLTQISKLTYIRDQLRAEHERMLTEISDRRRICYTLGCFVGLMLIIIVI